MKKRENKVIENVLIEHFAAEGKSIAKIDNQVIFITGGIPKDLVNIEIVKKKNRYLEAKVIKIISPSPDRMTPICEHFGLCGGCKWQDLSYEKQLEYKQQQIQDHFERIGKLTFEKISSILPAPKTQFYRNKLDFTFSNHRWLTHEQIKSEEKFDRRALGFHIPGCFDKIVDINICYLQSDLSNRIKNSLRTFVLSKDLSFHDIKKHEGLLRNLIIRTSNSSQEVMLIVVFYAKTEQDFLDRDLVLNFLQKEFSEITALTYINNLKMNDDIADQEVILWAGKDHITESMRNKQGIDLQFKISPKSFYQTNSEQAQKLYEVVADFADIQKGQIVYDLYTGTGTIAQFIAQGAEKVIGIEYVESAIINAKENAKLNNLHHLHFFAGDMKHILNPDFVQEQGMPDLIITDPPRAGMDEKVIVQILQIKPKKIVYVSCNSATQARDLALMQELYQITRIQPVDMFPHTHHVENVVLLELKN